MPTQFPPEAPCARPSAARRSPPRPPLDATGCRWSRWTRSARRTWTRRSTWSGPGGGYRVYYAIADVAAFVAAGRRARRRRPGGAASPSTARTEHPAASAGAVRGRRLLLPDGTETRGAVDDPARPPDGEPTEVDVQRAMVASVARLDYPQCQRDMDAGALHPSIALLPEFGELRAAARPRAARHQPRPARFGGGPSAGRALDDRAAGRAADRASYNAEVSLLTGMCAAAMMLDGGVGLLRTLPAPSADQVAALRTATAALGIPWPRGTPSRRRDRRAGRQPAAGRRLPGGRRPAAARRRLHRRSTASRPSGASTAASARRTPTSPRRCGGSPTGTPPRSAWRCTPGRRCRSG